MTLKVNDIDLVSSPTESFNLPVGTLAQRPAAPVQGMIRYNSETKKVEVYSSGIWRSIATTVSWPSSNIGPGTNVIYGWGSNEYGEALLPATVNPITVPTQSNETFNYKKIVTSIGGDSTFVIASDDTLWAVGNNEYGQLGLGDTVNRSVLTKVGTDTWIDISCYGNHAAGIKTNGTLWTWGSNDTGQLAQGDLINYTAPNQVGTLSVWSSVACGESHTIVTRIDGTMWGAGNNSNGQLGIGNTTNSSVLVKTSSTVTTAWVKVFCGQNSSYALNSDTYMYSWGNNVDGQLGLNTITASYTVPTRITALPNIINGFVSVGRAHVLAVNTSNYLYVWGNNSSGQLGTGSTTSLRIPTRYGTGSTWWKCAAGNDYSLALTSDGTMYGSGLNNKAQLGLDDTTNRLVFEQTSSIFWGEMVAGKNNTVASITVAATTYGGQSYTTANTFYFDVPDNVYSICAAVIGGGGAGGYRAGGGGGGAAYANNIRVVPGQKIRIIVGSPGIASGEDGSPSSIALLVNGVYVTLLTGTGGIGGTQAGSRAGGTYSITDSGYIMGTSGGFNGGSGGYYINTSNYDGASSGSGLGSVGSAGGGGAMYISGAGSIYDVSRGGNGWPSTINGGRGGYGTTATSGGGGGGGGGSLGNGLLGSNGSSSSSYDGAPGGMYGGGGGGKHSDVGYAHGTGRNGAARII